MPIVTKKPRLDPNAQAKTTQEIDSTRFLTAEQRNVIYQAFLTHSTSCKLSTSKEEAAKGAEALTNNFIRLLGKGGILSSTNIETLLACEAETLPGIYGVIFALDRRGVWENNPQQAQAAFDLTIEHRQYSDALQKKLPRNDNYKDRSFDMASERADLVKFLTMPFYHVGARNINPPAGVTAPLMATGKPTAQSAAVPVAIDLVHSHSNSASG